MTLGAASAGGCLPEYAGSCESPDALEPPVLCDCGSIAYPGGAAGFMGDEGESTLRSRHQGIKFRGSTSDTADIAWQDRARPPQKSVCIAGSDRP